MAKRKQIGLIPTTTGEWILAGAVVYLSYDKIIRPLLETLGLKKSQEQQNVENEANNPLSPFAGNNFLSKAPAGSLILTQADADKYATDIWNSVGYFYDDFEKCFSVFKKLKTQSQVAALAQKFADKYKKDLVTWLMGDVWPSDRFSDTQVNAIITYVHKLPKYKL